MPPVTEYDPHRTRNGVLTEVRTVLSRAETALETIGDDPRWVVEDGYWDYASSPPAYVADVTIPHPDGAEIIAALRRTVAELERWRGPNKRRGPR
jgi:hypothetical protein